MDAEFNLAFKRSMAWSEEDFADTDQQEVARYKALIYELIALELLSMHPNVIDLLGITWETDADTEQVWPVLLTERSIYGTMADFLRSEDGVELDCRAKLDLCTDVARACQALHTLGIVHGDIKQENVLIFSNGEAWTSKLIDFGYSCLGTSDNDMVRVARTRPWQAPEHSEDRSFQLNAARRMDVYSFGMLVCRTFLSGELSASIGKVGHCDDLGEHLQLLEHIDSLKASSDFLDLVLEALRLSKSIDQACEENLRQIFELTLQHEPQLRSADFNPIIGNMLADLDDTDYILHRTLVDDLKRRTSRRRPCACFQSAVYQLWLCYEIGFGVARDSQKASEWLSRGTSGAFNISDILKNIDKEYDPRRPVRLIEKLGYDTNLQFDPVELYRVQDRLDEAEQAFREEVRGREESMGPRSKSHISQLSTLAIILSLNGNPEEAEIVSRSAAKSSQESSGENSLETINAQNYLASILFQRGKWAELEQLQVELIPRKQNHEEIGDKDTTTLNSQNLLLAAYCFQGQYDKCIDLAREVATFREEELGKEHPETLVTLNWLCRALLEKGDFSDLESLAKGLIAASEKACGNSDESVVERKEILAAILLGEAKPHHADVDTEKLEEAMNVICEVLDECDKEDANLILVTRAQTTLICILALQGHFDNATREIEQAMLVVEALKKYLSSDYIEIQRLLKVKENTACLQKLEDKGKKGLKQADLIRERLAHRWKL
ncbi:hypothetical protein V498_00364 [Pseudogymnoascus sp. VKM F-4517 (FW-2822)]|nr:hypothetical protein V498_00364 [Pseudogymnoascus sp. VKM F-4517 (FW-2822)]